MIFFPDSGFDFIFLFLSVEVGVGVCVGGVALCCPQQTVNIRV